MFDLTTSPKSFLYHEIKNTSSSLISSTLSERLSNAEVIDISTIKSDVVGFGAKVKLLDLNTEKEITYQFLSEYESDTSKGILAIESLIGRALIGKKVGDEVEIKIPAGIKEYEILSIEYK